MIGRTLSHFRILSKLGEGGMGVVYRAEDVNLGRAVAFKVLPPDLAGDEGRRARFIREARAAAAVSHDRIATVYEIDDVDGVIFIAMELIEGMSLATWIAGKPLPLRDVLRYGMELAEGLTHAHAQNVIHRDLKPDNVMITSNGHVKILDFGLAKLLEEEPEGESTSDLDTASAEVTREGRILGTAAYMSPEQARGVPVDSRSDLFSLGTMLYEMVTGRHPFRGDTAMDALTAIIKERPEPPSGLNPAVPNELERVIHKCLEKEPGDRYQHADEIVVNLRKMISTSGETAVRDVQVGRPRLTRWVAPALGLLLVVAVVAIVVMWRSGRPVVAPDAAKPSVAVLPFENLSPDRENQYFSEGVTEEIINKLSRIDSLEVASRTSITRYKETKQDVKAIGAELGVRYLLEGSVRKAGNQARITAQLVDVTTGFHLWSEDFDVELKDIFEVQERTALEIVQALDVQLRPHEQKAVEYSSTTDPQAYDAYLRGRALMERFDDPEKLEAARAHFERALERDRAYAPALVGLARVEALYHRGIDPSPERQSRAESLARLALTLEPDLAEGHLALGLIHGNGYDYARAVENFREALRIDPDSALAWDQLSWALAYLQPPDAVGAEEAARKSIRLQPSLIGAYYHLGRALLLQQRYDEAVAAFEQAKALDADFESAHYGLGLVHLERGEPDRALVQFDKMLVGRRTPIILFAAAQAYAQKGDADSALENLSAAFEAGYRDFDAIDASTHLDSLRSNARFEELIRRYRAAGDT